MHAFAPEKFKPYVNELHPLDGDNILRDAPHDYWRHHALMRGNRVHGADFWEDTAQYLARSNPRPGRSAFRGRSAVQLCRQCGHQLP